MWLTGAEPATSWWRTEIRRCWDTCRSSGARVSCSGERSISELLSSREQSLAREDVAGWRGEGTQQVQVCLDPHTIESRVSKGCLHHSRPEAEVTQVSVQQGPKGKAERGQAAPWSITQPETGRDF